MLRWLEKQSGQERLTAIFNSDIFNSLFSQIAGQQFPEWKLIAPEKSKVMPLINKSVNYFFWMQ
jgi:hypothetical protein